MTICINCDNCQNKTNKNNNVVIPKQDYTKQIYLLLNLLTRIDNKFGMLTIINILIGNAKKVKEYLTNFEEFGTGISFGNELWWRTFIRLLINEDYLIESQVLGLYGTTLGLTNKGKTCRKNLINKYPKYLNLIQATYEDNISDNNDIKIMLEQIVVINTKTKSIKSIKSTKSTKSTKSSNLVSKQVINIINNYEDNNPDNSDNYNKQSFTFNNKIPSVFMKYGTISDSESDTESINNKNINMKNNLDADLEELEKELSEKSSIKEEIIVVKPKRKYTKKINKL
jgi:superfamily II DNA helicase RecQ